MDCKSTRLPYRQTGAFSRISTDYIDQAPELRPFFEHPPTLQGIKTAIEARKQFSTDRTLLVRELRKQYEAVNTSVNTEKNISDLLNETTFTVTTAHQPNLLTGPLYFIYKILHTIKLAENCKTIYPEYDFVPVYYMGSEDADLDELGHFYLDGVKHTWNTDQTGAVGKMQVDKLLIKLISDIEGQISVLPYGDEIVSVIKESYVAGISIQEATFKLVNHLFGSYGLVILIPDNASLKKQMVRIFKDDLLNQTASSIVEETAEKLKNAGFKIQANPREINLFYLKNGSRERIIEKEGRYSILKEGISFSRDEIIRELNEHPERFSPNVILRGIYQETILPNIIFIGGGGETAYWLQLKELYRNYQVPYPVLVLRNSFLFIEKKWQDKIRKTGFTAEDLFLPVEQLITNLVERERNHYIKLNGSLSEIEQLYDSFKKQAVAVDSTLEKHVDALKVRTIYRLQELEKKMLRAEKRKFNDQQRQLTTIREKLFPYNSLQERIDNFLPYYGRWGKEWIEELYEHSLNLEQEFVILAES